jgi:arylformamidase
MIPFTKCYDISVLLGVENATYPGDQPFVRSVTTTITDIVVNEESNLTLSSHAGTHVDAPAHFIGGGAHLDDYPPEYFVMPACVIEVPDCETVPVAHLEGTAFIAGEAILLKTTNSRSGLVTSGQLSERFTVISPEAANWLANHSPRLVAIDYLSVDPIGSPDCPAHKALLGAGVLVMENANLRDVPPGRYTLLCLPLRILGAEGSPVRAVLLEL